MKIAIIIAIVAIAIAGAAFSIRLDWAWWGELEGAELSRAQIFSNIVGPLSGIAALIALAINFVTANATLSQSVRTEQATRFQKAVDLLGEAKNTPIVAGVALLSGLARENPKVYLLPVAETLAAALTDIDDEFKKKCCLFSISNEVAFTDEFPRAALASFAMFEWFGNLRPIRVDEWPRELLPGLAVGRQPLFSPYLEDSVYIRKNFARTDIERAVIRDVTFDTCNLAHISWRCFAAGGDLLFQNCDLRGARLKIWKADNTRLWHPTDLVKVEGGKTDGLEINGLPYDDWVKGAFLEDTMVAKWVTNPPIQDGGWAGRTWKRAFG